MENTEESEENGWLHKLLEDRVRIITIAPSGGYAFLEDKDGCVYHVMPPGFKLRVIQNKSTAYVACHFGFYFAEELGKEACQTFPSLYDAVEYVKKVYLREWQED